MRTVQSLFVAALCVIGAVQSADAAERKPNIIVFYSDDHGHADLGVQQAVKDIKTPNIDALARSGVLAKHGYSTAPQCVPSRGALMVGKFQGRFQLDNNKSELDGFNRETTIASRLSKVGYTTAHFGKWHLGPHNEIINHGFKYTFGHHGQQSYVANITTNGEDRPLGEVKSDAYHIDACSQAAASIIKRYHDQPLFLYVAYRAPHTPLDAPKKYTNRFPGEMPERRRQALAMISAIDDGVGLITRTLAELKLTEHTLIFFIGDNGAPLKIHKVDSPVNTDAGGWDGSLNTPLNGEKGMLAEGGMHVPFVISWPGHFSGGQLFQHPISALDVAATAASIANVATNPGDFDGVNLIPYLSGEIKTAPHERLLWRWMAQSAIREGRWKLLRGGDREYLYDLETDLGEQKNLAAQHPEIAAKLRAQLKAWCDELNPPGLALGPMSKTWDDYFDHYLEGKTIPLPPKVADAPSPQNANYWQVRNGTLTVQDGVFQVSQDKASGKTKAFITKAKLNLNTPLKLKFSTNANEKGDIMIAWRIDGQSDFSPENKTTIKATVANEWQDHELTIPGPGKVIHIRIHLPSNSCQFKGLK